MSKAKRVAVIGAGPVGLAAAAHLLERGIVPVVLEAGPDIGHALRQWQHVQLFSPWEYNVDEAARRLLAPTGWNSPEPDVYPTGSELLERYLQPLASKTALASYIHTSSRVTDISRVGFDKLKTKGREAAPFEIRYQNGQGPKSILADAIMGLTVSNSMALEPGLLRFGPLLRRATAVRPLFHLSRLASCFPCWRCPQASSAMR